MQPPYIIAPSILAADFAKLGKEAMDVQNAGADWLHIDVMDNHFVPNLTIGDMLCKALKNYGITIPLDVHLMVDPVDRLIDDFAKAGADYISIHQGTSTRSIKSLLQQIKQAGCKAGIVINPSESISVLEKIIDKVDLILIMAVEPGFGGQKLIEDTYTKLKKTRQLINDSGKNVKISVDGGVNINNIADLAKAGANCFVAGSAIFGQDNYNDIINNMRNKLSVG